VDGIEDDFALGVQRGCDSHPARDDRLSCLKQLAVRRVADRAGFRSTKDTSTIFSTIWTRKWLWPTSKTGSAHSSRRDSF
jgi:hypothetical protein